MADILEVYDIKNNTTEDIGDKKSRANVAAAFNTSKTYAINDLTVYNGELYKFTADHSAGAWDASHIAKTTIENEFVKKSGDTITGSLDTSAEIHIHSSSITYGVAPTSNKWGSPICFQANDNNDTGVIRNIYRSSGENQLNVSVIQLVNGSAVENYLRLGVDTSGTMTVSIANRDPWLTALGFTDSDWQSLTNSSIYSGTIYYRKFGIFLGFQFRITLATQLAGESSIKIGTLPSGYRPSKEIGSSCMTFSGLYPRIFGLRITSSGEIYIYSNKEAIPTTISLMANGTYILT